MRLSHSSRLTMVGTLLGSLAAIGCTGDIEDGNSPAMPGAGTGANAPIGAGSASAGGSTAGGAGNQGGTGAVNASGGSTGAQAGAGGASVACGDGLTSRRVRRLSRREYSNVVTDLLGASFGAQVTELWPFEARMGGFDNLDRLDVGPALQVVIADLAAEIAAKVDATTVAPCSTSGGSTACLQTFAKSFAGKAFGRPATDPELASLSTVAATGENYSVSVRLIIETVLQTPQFIYVSELGATEAPAAPGQALALTPYEMASQLSFMLNGSRPDAALIQAAETTRFATPADIRKEAERLLTTARSKGELARFINGWLDMGPVAEAPKSPTAYPEMTAQLVAAMQQEFDSFVDTQLKGGEGTVSSFMSEVSKNIPTALTTLYGADFNAATGLNVERRRGVLSLPGFLTFHSADYHSGPVERGLFVRKQLFCQNVPPPPESALQQIADKPVDNADTQKTTRQKFDIHVNEPSCKACHAAFDPIGFGFEQMDGLGRYRTTENGLPVDSKGELTGTDVDGPFEGPAQLAGMLSKSKMYEACMVDHFFRFAQSRSREVSDQCVVNDWVTQFSQGGGRIKDLIFAYAAHRTFANRKDDR